MNDPKQGVAVAAYSDTGESVEVIDTGVRILNRKVYLGKSAFGRTDDKAVVARFNKLMEKAWTPGCRSLMIPIAQLESSARRSWRRRWFFS